MRVYIEPLFINYFLSLPKDKSKAVEILWNIINSYAEVTWVFSSEVSFEDFERWEISDTFYTMISSKGSNQVLLNRDFQKDIKKHRDDAQIFLACKYEKWHEEIKNDTLILMQDDFQKTVQEFERKFTFKFISDENNSWNEFHSLQSNLVSSIIITDKYVLSNYLEKNNLRKFDNNFIYLINKITLTGKEHLKILIKSTDVDRGNYDGFKKKIISLSAYFKGKIHPDINVTIVNAELDSDFDFHDRNIFTPYYIVKTGRGFERAGKKSINTEVECYSFLDKWGYDLIRHRSRMVSNYEKSISQINTPFKSVTI